MGHTAPSATKRMKTVLISGGSGFLGSHLCDRLIQDHHILCLDNFFTGRHSNIAHLRDRTNFELIEHDIINPIYFEDRKIDMIYNLACPASPIHYQHNAIRTTKTNVLGTINLLGMAKIHQARILQASTSEVYGDPLEHPQTESYRGNVNPIGLRSCYDEGKRCAETLMFDYHRQHDVAIRVIRIFNTYGPRMSAEDGRVVSNFVIQALKGNNITVYGSGDQTRSFCFVSDLIEGMIRHMENDHFVGPVNLGNPNEFTILELAQSIIRLTESSSQIVFEELPKDDPRRRKPDISLAKETLDWEPKIELTEGLRKTIDYFQQLESQS
jgi:UDP-glucuronate decarboxylase